MCPASSQQAGFRAFSEKNSAANSHFGKHTQNTVLTAIFYHLSRMGTVPQAIRKNGAREIAIFKTGVTL
jgi:hypothetical protein